MARKTKQVEVRMVSEYCLLTYSQFPTIFDCPLGAVPETLMAEEGYAKALSMTRQFRPRVDAIVILPRYLLLIESKVWQIMNGLGKLPLYKSLVPITPELKDFRDYEVLMELVVGWTNTNLERMAGEVGVKVKLFCPSWLEEVVSSMHKYWTPEYRHKRSEKLRMRELLGLE